MKAVLNIMFPSTINRNPTFESVATMIPLYLLTSRLHIVTFMGKGSHGTWKKEKEKVVGVTYHVEHRCQAFHS